MVDEDDVTTAGHLLATIEKQTPATIEGWAELGEGYLDVSRHYERGGETDAAFNAARDGIRRLSPTFLKDPEDLAEPMRGLVAQYLALTEHSKHKADKAMLMPIATALGHLIDYGDD